MRLFPSPSTSVPRIRATVGIVLPTRRITTTSSATVTSHVSCCIAQLLPVLVTHLAVQLRKTLHKVVENPVHLDVFLELFFRLKRVDSFELACHLPRRALVLVLIQRTAQVHLLHMDFLCLMWTQRSGNGLTLGLSVPATNPNQPLVSLVEIQTGLSGAKAGHKHFSGTVAKLGIEPAGAMLDAHLPVEWGGHNAAIADGS